MGSDRRVMSITKLLLVADRRHFGNRFPTGESPIGDRKPTPLLTLSSQIGLNKCFSYARCTYQEFTYSSKSPRVEQFEGFPSCVEFRPPKIRVCTARLPNSQTPPTLLGRSAALPIRTRAAAAWQRTSFTGSLRHASGPTVAALSAGARDRVLTAQLARARACARVRVRPPMAPTLFKRPFCYDLV